MQQDKQIRIKCKFAFNLHLSAFKCIYSAFIVNLFCSWSWFFCQNLMCTLSHQRGLLLARPLYPSRIPGFDGTERDPRGIAGVLGSIGLIKQAPAWTRAQKRKNACAVGAFPGFGQARHGHAGDGGWLGLPCFYLGPARLLDGLAVLANDHFSLKVFQIFLVPALRVSAFPHVSSSYSHRYAHVYSAALRSSLIFRTW